MPVSYQPLPPNYSGALKDLAGIPPPFSTINIWCPSDTYRDPQKSQKIDQQEQLTIQRVAKIIRRLLLKAGVPVLGADQWLQENPVLFFKVNISVSILDPFPATVDMKLIQGVLLERDPAIKIDAVTWSYGPTKDHFYRDDEDVEYAIQYQIDNIIRKHVLAGVQSLVYTYKNDNRVNDIQLMDRSYNTGPLDEGKS